MVCFGLLLFFVGSLAATPTPGCDPPFLRLGGEWCIFVNITVPPRKGIGNPLTWIEASESCTGYPTAYLVTLHDPKKLQAISTHLDQECSAETKLGWVYWVGARGMGKNWMWVKTQSKIELQSNIWMPNQPSEATETTAQYGRLAPTYGTNGRRYLVSDKADGISPAYICEKPWSN